MARAKNIIILNDPRHKKFLDKFINVVSAKKLAKLHTLLRGNSMTLPLACRTVGISLGFFKQAMGRIPALRDWIDEAIEEANSRIATSLRKAAEDGHFPSQTYILDRTEEFTPPAQRTESTIASSHVERIEKGIKMVIVAASTKPRKKIKNAKARVIDVQKLENEEVN